MDTLKIEVTFLSAITNKSLLWHKRIGRASFSTINKLVAKNLVIGLIKTKLDESMVYDVCAKGKYVRSSFKDQKW